MFANDRIPQKLLRSCKYKRDRESVREKVAATQYNNEWKSNTKQEGKKCSE